MKKAQLLPKELLEKLPRLGEEEVKNPMVLVKYFYPDFSWTWYGISFDPMDEIFFGFVDGDFQECGDFSLKELIENRGKSGCEIERDLYFQPIRLDDLTKKLKR